MKQYIIKIAKSWLGLILGLILFSGVNSHSLAQSVISPHKMIKSAPWKRAESTRIILYSANDLELTIAYAKQLEAFDAISNELLQELGDSKLPQVRKDTFYYLATHKDYKIVNPNIARDSISIYTTSKFDEAQFFMSNDYNVKYKPTVIVSDDLSYLFEAFTYKKIKLHFSYKLPKWVHDGLIYYLMSMSINDDSAIVGITPQVLLHDTGEQYFHTNALLPFSDIISDKVIYHNYESVIRFQQWFLVHYLLTDPERKKKFINYLERIANGEDELAAFQMSIGIKPDELKKIYYQNLHKGTVTLNYKLSNLKTPQIDLKTLPNYHSPLPLISAALKAHQDPEYGKTLLDHSRQTFAEFPEDDLARMTVARAEIEFGDPQKVHPIVTAKLTQDPKNFEAQNLLGRLYLALATRGDPQSSDTNYRLAREALSKSYQLDPTSAPNLYFLAKAHANLPNYPDDNTLNMIALAKDYSGGGYNNYQIELWVRKDRYDEALALVQKDLASPSAAETALIEALKAKAPKETIIKIIQDLDK